MKTIKLSQGKFALVDDDDYEYINQWKWCVKQCKQNYYAGRRIIFNGKYKFLYMHRFINNTENNLQVDHIDHNGLNNQRNNLRNCTCKQNRMNQKGRSKSGYRGVTYVKHYIVAQFPINGKTKHIGIFKTEEEAAKAYDKMAKLHYGEFANLNFPEKRF